MGEGGGKKKEIAGVWVCEKERGSLCTGECPYANVLLSPVK